MSNNADALADQAELTRLREEVYVLRQDLAACRGSVTVTDSLEWWRDVAMKLSNEHFALKADLAALRLREAEHVQHLAWAKATHDAAVAVVREYQNDDTHGDGIDAFRDALDALVKAVNAGEGNDER